MISGQGRFDGMEVELYEGKFGGGFDLEDVDGERVSYDTTFVFMVTAIAGKTTFDVTNQGDVKRVTQFDLRDVVVLDPEDANAQYVLQELAGSLLAEEEIPGQTTVQAAIADADAADEAAYTEYEAEIEAEYDEPIEEGEEDLIAASVGAMGAQIVAPAPARNDEALSAFLDGPVPG